MQQQPLSTSADTRQRSGAQHCARLGRLAGVIGPVGRARIQTDGPNVRPLARNRAARQRPLREDQTMGTGSMEKLAAWRPQHMEKMVVTPKLSTRPTDFEATKALAAAGLHPLLSRL